MRTKNSNYLKITLSPAPQVLQVVPETPVSDPIKIEEPTETIPVQVQTCPPDERRPDTADIQAETSPIPVTLHLERSLDNSSGEAFEEPYNYNFDQHHPLTHEDVNQISEIKGFHHHEEEINALKEENYKLKEEMEEIKSEHLVKQSELKAQIEGSQSKIQQDILNFEETIKKLEREKETIR